MSQDAPLILDKETRYRCQWNPKPERKNAAPQIWFVDAFDHIDAVKRTIHEHGGWNHGFFMHDGDVIEIFDYLEGSMESRRIFRLEKRASGGWAVNADPNVCSRFGAWPCAYAFGRSLASYPVCSSFEFNNYDQPHRRQQKNPNTQPDQNP